MLGGGGLWGPGANSRSNIYSVPGFILNIHTCYCVCNELGGNMARFTQFPFMITRSTIIYEIISPGAAGSSIYV